MCLKYKYITCMYSWAHYVPLPKNSAIISIALKEPIVICDSCVFRSRA